MATFALNVQVVHPGTVASSLPSLDTFARPSRGSDSAPVTLTSEQAVVAFDRSHPGQPLAVRYPAQGTFQLSYPYVLTTTGGVTLAAAKAFGGVLRSSYANAYVRYEGFRTGTGAASAWPASYGLTSAEPHLLRPPGPDPGLARNCTPGTCWASGRGSWPSTTSPPRWPPRSHPVARPWSRCSGAPRRPG